MPTASSKSGRSKDDKGIATGHTEPVEKEHPPGFSERDGQYRAFHFLFGEAHVRAATRDGKPVFMNADVCRALGLASKKRSFAHHLEKLAPNQKFQVQRAAFFPGSPLLKGGLVPVLEPAPQTHPGVDEPSEADEGPLVWAISEAGLYTLIVRSRGATTPGTVANLFLTWVTEEVLPAIRSTGRYAAGSLNEGSMVPLDLRKEARYVVLNFPGLPPTISITPVDAVFDEWSALDTEILANQIRTVAALWQKTQLARSVGGDPAGTALYDQLGEEIFRSRGLANEYLRAMKILPN